MALTFGTSDPKAAYVLAREVAAKRLRKLAPKIYTDDFKSPPEDIIRRYRFEIVAHFYPGCVISFRSGLLGGDLSPENRFHLSIPHSQITSKLLPGMEIRIWPGPGPQASDQPMPTPAGKVFLASRSRALLENFLPGRARGASAEAKTLSRLDLEAWLAEQIRLNGIAELHRLIAHARELAQALSWQAPLAQLETFAAAIEGKGDVARLRAPTAVARAQGVPYDPHRLALFEALHARLASESFLAVPATPASERSNRAFWESYFSNYIEGTKFTVEEAQSIILAADPQQILKKRPQDAHDILETYRLIIDDEICRDVPGGITGFFDLLKRRHARMMASRPEVDPGVFKRLANQVGSKLFVAPELVIGTLQRVWPLVRALKDPVARALSIHFSLAEIHPFADGNGRISRLFLNAELQAAGRMRILIPTAYRADYLGVLDALTRNSNAEPYIGFAHRLLELNQAIPYQSPIATTGYFKKIGALEEEIGLGFNFESLAR